MITVRWKVGGMTQSGPTYERLTKGGNWIPISTRLLNVIIHKRKEIIVWNPKKEGE